MLQLLHCVPITMSMKVICDAMDIQASLRTRLFISVSKYDCDRGTHVCLQCWGAVMLMASSTAHLGLHDAVHVTAMGCKCRGKRVRPARAGMQELVQLGCNIERCRVLLVRERLVQEKCQVHKYAVQLMTKQE